MSIDISWDTITSGPDGEALAETIRDFIHTKFQQIPLPRFIKAVHVHSFAFGSACPEVEIKDISDPLPDFYEDDDSEGSDQVETDADHNGHSSEHVQRLGNNLPTLSAQAQAPLHPTSQVQNRLAAQLAEQWNSASSHPASPGIPGGTSNFSYFHMPIGGISGSQTPLAAVASGNLPAGWHHEIQSSNFNPLSHGSGGLAGQVTGHLPHQDFNDPSTRPSTAHTNPALAGAESPLDPASPERIPLRYPHAEKVSDDPLLETPLSPPPMKLNAVQPSDLQVVARVQYSGDVRMTLTAEILLDYPMPSFVGIPLKLSITGISFDGVAILAYIRKRMHFCFLDPEDAETLVGDHVTQDQSKSKDSSSSVLGLLREIHIESEIGRQESGKQVLKNVGNVEKFVLEQIRRIFEEEFVFPSFWTFLV